MLAAESASRLESNLYGRWYWVDPRPKHEPAIDEAGGPELEPSAGPAPRLDRQRLGPEALGPGADSPASSLIQPELDLRLSTDLSGDLALRVRSRFRSIQRLGDQPDLDLAPGERAVHDDRYLAREAMLCESRRDQSDDADPRNQVASQAPPSGVVMKLQKHLPL